MDGSILITGGTRGLGFATVRALLREDAGRHLIIPARNLSTAREALAQLTAQLAPATGGGDRKKGSDLGNLHLVECDLADLASIRRGAAAIGELLDQPGVPPLRALAANAGIQRWREPGQTADGFEMTFGTNVLGHYLLIRLLTERATGRASGRVMEQGRVILVTSSTHWGDFQHTWGVVAPPRWGSVESLARPATPAPSNRKAATSAYSTSKLGLIYLTHELARRLPPEYEVFSYNPGLIPGTGITREAPAIARFLGRTFFQSVRMLPGAVGARTSGTELARTLTGPSPARSGDYLDRGRLADSSPESHDPKRELELWEVGARLVGIATAG